MPAKRRGAPKSCGWCKTIYTPWAASRQDRSRFCSRACHGAWTGSIPHAAYPWRAWTEERRERDRGKFTGDKNPGWKGGRIRRKDGYMLLNVGANKQRLEHRVIAEGVLGRRLKFNETVHHINMNRADNRNTNLMICSRAYNKWLASAYAKKFAERFN